MLKMANIAPRRAVSGVFVGIYKSAVTVCCSRTLIYRSHIILHAEEFVSGKVLLEKHSGLCHDTIKIEVLRLVTGHVVLCDTLLPSPAKLRLGGYSGKVFRSVRKCL